MFTNEQLLEQECIIEAILFMMGDTVSVDTLATALSSSVDIAKEAAERLTLHYENEYSNRGMKIIRVNNKYQMVSNNKYFKNLVAVASKPQKPVLTDSILETLSIIAYKQPITKPEIEDIRGVKSDFAVNRLIEYGLIEEKGRLDAPGRPIILGTTEEFLRRFGLESTNDLPELDELRQRQIETEVEKELSATLGEPVVINDGTKDNNDDNQNVDEINNNENVSDNNESINDNDLQNNNIEDNNTENNENNENNENTDSTNNEPEINSLTELYKNNSDSDDEFEEELYNEFTKENNLPKEENNNSSSIRIEDDTNINSYNSFPEDSYDFTPINNKTNNNDNYDNNVNNNNNESKINRSQQNSSLNYTTDKDYVSKLKDEETQ